MTMIEIAVRIDGLSKEGRFGTILTDWKKIPEFNKPSKQLSSSLFAGFREGNIVKVTWKLGDTDQRLIQSVQLVTDDCEVRTIATEFLTSLWDNR